MPFIGAQQPPALGPEKIADRKTHTADGISKSFDARYDQENVMVFKNGLKQIEKVDYNLDPNGFYITFVNTPAANDVIECVGSIEVTDIARNSYKKESFVLDGTLDYVPIVSKISTEDRFNVFFNGIRLVRDVDYEISFILSRIIFKGDLAEGDRIEVEIIQPGYRVHRDSTKLVELADVNSAYQGGEALHIDSSGQCYFIQPGTTPAGQIAAFAMPNAPGGWLICDGSNNLSMMDFPMLYDALCIRGTANVVSGSNVITINSFISALQVHNGLSIRGVGIPEGTTISTVDSPTQYTLSTVATETNSDVEISLLPWGFGSDDSKFRIPDLRGEFLRGWDAGRGTTDADRTFGSWQQDAIRNLTGRFGLIWIGADGYNTGVFYNSNEGTSWYGDNIHSHRQKYIRMDASRQVPTAADNRPRNLAVNYCIKY